LKTVEALSVKSGENISEIAGRLLVEALDMASHELFQVSTSSALVKGVFSGAISVADLRRHGDFGLGTFADLDGELVMLDGEVFQAGSRGRVSEAEDGWQVPFALITEFQPDIQFRAAGPLTLESLSSQIDAHRPSSNLFVAIRGDGAFDSVAMRAICRAEPGETLVEATMHQSEFTIEDVEGTLVGFWSPSYAKTMSIPGYHFHFLAEDRSIAGHVFGLTARKLELSLHTESDLHLALPRTAEFLAADLSGETSEDLERAERERR
jgi:acetolactate decarboxylase